jgi:acetoin utilization protein AcuC
VKDSVTLYVSPALGRYGFPDGHPFGTDRQDAFWSEAVKQGLDRKVEVCSSALAQPAETERFHSRDYVQRVVRLSQLGSGSIDYGDTPAFPGVYEASLAVVGAALDGVRRIMSGESNRTFQPIGGLHHARREGAAGFCVFNDCAVVIETLREEFGIKRVAYVDIDVHHGDGLYYPYESDPDLIIVDIHEDGRFLYPGTGYAHEEGKDLAVGSKLNVPLEPGAADREFFAAWGRTLEFIRHYRPEFILFQCGADSIAGDPLAHLRYTPRAHAHAARTLCQLANEFAHGRIMGFGGGGYDRRNLALAWNSVLAEFITTRVD